MLESEERPHPITVSLEDYKARHANDDSVTVQHLPNWCPHCRMWVTNRHDQAHCATVTQVCAAKQMKTNTVTKRTVRAGRPLNRNLAEDRTVDAVSYRTDKRLLALCTSVSRFMPENVFEIARTVSQKASYRHLTAFKRWLTERKMVAQRHPNAPPKVRTLEKILAESRYFPN